MPYIAEKSREPFIPLLKAFEGKMKNKGELEFVLYSLLTIYKNEHKWCYSDLHDACYAAHHVGHEFCRHNLDVRENEARELNGGI
jgi:hypothetical protein